MDRQHVTGTASIVRADSRQLPLADDSVDLVVTSPPYFGLRSYQDGGEHYAGQVGDEATPAEFIDALIEVTAECMRVLKPSGSLWVNLGDKYSTYESRPGKAATHEWAQKSQQAERYTKSAPSAYGIKYKSLFGIPWRYALRCIDELGLILRAEVVWAKPNGMPESITDRVRRSHETWFHFTLATRYFSNVDEIREAHSGPRKSPGGSMPGKAVGPLDRGGRSQWERTREEREATVRHALGKLPGSVWEIATEPLLVPDHVSHARCCDGLKRPGCEDGVDHYAAFPTEWPRRIIQGWSPADGVVLDPFGGTGTTALVAKALGRQGITVDMSADYCRIAEWRTNDPQQLAKAARRPHKPSTPPIDGQDSLLDLITDAS